MSKLTKVENKSLKIALGLEAQGHLPTIEKILNKWNQNDMGVDMTYTRHVWVEIGDAIGWDSLTAALSYFEHLNRQKNGNDD